MSWTLQTIVCDRVCQLRAAHVRMSLVLASMVILQFPFQTAHGMTEEVDFHRDVLPILEERCWSCHSDADAASGLRLDLRTRMLAGGDSGLPAIRPGEPAASYLLDAVKHLDPVVKMPPDEDRIPDAEINVLERWIAQGAMWPGQMDAAKEEKPELWSFQPVVRPPVPANDDAHANPIDAFLLKSLHERQLSYSPAAEPPALLRRLAIVLTGLPPTPEETEHFAAAFADDPDRAYHYYVSWSCARSV